MIKCHTDFCFFRAQLWTRCSIKAWLDNRLGCKFNFNVFTYTSCRFYGNSFNSNLYCGWLIVHVGTFFCNGMFFFFFSFFQHFWKELWVSAFCNSQRKNCTFFIFPTQEFYIKCLLRIFNIKKSNFSCPLWPDIRSIFGSWHRRAFPHFWWVWETHTLCSNKPCP